jgi:hypothetical protein
MGINNIRIKGVKPPVFHIYICDFIDVRVEVFTAVTMKNAIFWDVVPCRSCVNRRFGGKYRLHLQGRKIRELQPPAHAGSSLADFSTPKMEAIRSSETSVHKRSTLCHIPENGIFYRRCFPLSKYADFVHRNEKPTGAIKYCILRTKVFKLTNRSKACSSKVDVKTYWKH